MKSVNKYITVISSAFLLTACSKDFLNRPPEDTITSANFYTNDDQIAAGTGPLYNIVWFDYNDKALLSFGEARGGNLQSNDRTAYIQFAVPATDQNTLFTGYKSFYKIVAQSNLTMQNITGVANSTASESMKRTGLAECKFMRAMAYYYLVSNWGAVPIIYDNVSQLGDASVVPNTTESVWQFIIKDLVYAAKNLPATPYAQGRVTKYSAEGMLAKMYLTRAGIGGGGTRKQSDLDSAKYYAGDVVKNSGLSLVSNYNDLFTSANNNCDHNNNESLFALQWQPVSSPWGVNNSFQAYMAFDPKVTQTGDGWGSAQGCSADLLKYYIAHPEDSLRRKATVMFNADVYKELNQKDGGTTVTATSISNLKKYVIGSPADNGGKGNFMAAYINTYMMRLAEVYLIYAESILGNTASTADADALHYFNAVRTRAGLSAKSSITFGDIFQEKRVETAMEGGAWYEILRWYYFDPTGAKNYVAAQDKGSYTIAYQDGTSAPRKYTTTYTSAYYPVTDQTIYLPIPEAERVAAPNLSKPPVPFDFNKLPKDY